MRFLASISTLTCIALVCGCAQQLEQVKQVNQALSTINGAPRGGNQPMNGGLQPTPSQTAAIDSQLSGPMGDKNIAEARKEAAANISKLLNIMSCTPPGSYPSAYLTPMKAPGSNATLHVPPTAHMRYHPKSQCLTVSRLDGWRMQAKNAFQFRAVYSSDASGEGASYGYTFIKQPDGAWLLGDPAYY